MRHIPRKLSLAFAVLALAAVGLGTPASAATDYRLPNWFKWEKAVLDVLIVPPNHGQIVNGRGVLGGLNLNELHPYQTSYLRAIEQSVADWDRGISTFGAAWLRSGLVTNVYVVGRDAIPTAALANPEVVITTDENKGPILGVAISSRPCIVDNSKFFITSFTEEDMYNINGQEYGHCLGLDHAHGTPSDDSVIAHDVMNGTYADNPGSVGTHRHCVSNLDVLGVERAFGGLFGQTSGGTAIISPSSYQRISC